MAASINDSKLVIPVVPTLAHLSVVKIALPLSKHIDVKSCFVLLKEVRESHPAKFDKAKFGNRKINKAKKNLLFVPPHFREKVLQAILGFDVAIKQWYTDHGFEKPINEIFRWKTDGTIDRVKTIQQYLKRQNTHIIEKFQFACEYFLEEEVKSLWAVVLEKKIFCVIYKAFYTPYEQFWLKRIKNRLEGPWKEDVSGHVEGFVKYPSRTFSFFFPLLKPEARSRLISFLTRSKSSLDFLFCLYSATKEEEKQILKREAPKLLLQYLNWPLQEFFLQMVEKMWNIIDYSLYAKLLRTIISYKWERQDFDYERLIVDLWAKSPAHLKEIAERDPYLLLHVDFCRESIKKRIKHIMDEAASMDFGKRRSLRKKRSILKRKETSMSKRKRPILKRKETPISKKKRPILKRKETSTSKKKRPNLKRKEASISKKKRN